MKTKTIGQVVHCQPTNQCEASHALEHEGCNSNDKDRIKDDIINKINKT